MCLIADCMLGQVNISTYLYYPTHVAGRTLAKIFNSVLLQQQFQQHSKGYFLRSFLLSSVYMFVCLSIRVDRKRGIHGGREGRRKKRSLG
uniref:Uncharacterized protein n=1 Tax=Octopus bimaculoides TaxID=37653 RepID=A0A0L8HA59_OCTBM